MGFKLHKLAFVLWYLNVGKMEILWLGFSPDFNITHCVYTGACWHTPWQKTLWLIEIPVSCQYLLGEGWRGNSQSPGCNWSGIFQSPERHTHRVPPSARKQRGKAHSPCWGAEGVERGPTVEAVAGEQRLEPGPETEMGRWEYSAQPTFLRIKLDMSSFLPPVFCCF